MTDYTTTDLCEAATFKTLGIPENIDRSNSRKIAFRYEYTEEFESTRKQFWSGEIKVDPMRFYQSLRALKAQALNQA